MDNKFGSYQSEYTIDDAVEVLGLSEDREGSEKVRGLIKSGTLKYSRNNSHAFISGASLMDHLKSEGCEPGVTPTGGNVATHAPRTAADYEAEIRRLRAEHIALLQPRTIRTAPSAVEALAASVDAMIGDEARLTALNNTPPLTDEEVDALVGQMIAGRR